MIAIAGNPRSGTSLMMRCFLEAVGKDRIMGDEFPRELRQDKMREKGEKESDAHFTARMYIYDKYPENDEEATEKFKDMNPNGFWECPFTVRGIKYRPNVKELFEQMDNEDKKKPIIVKLVNSGLFASDPKYIDKVVYMVRHPRSIAKSQERLKREQKFTLVDGREVDLFEGAKVHDPRLYIQSTTQFARWKLDNPDVPVLFVSYDDMITEPNKELARIAAFSKISKIKKSASLINPKLKRSEWDMTKESTMWSDAEAIHECLAKGDFQGIIDVTSNSKGAFAKQNLTFTCVRLRAAVAYNNCITCRRDNDTTFIESGIDRAIANGWDWYSEPCLFECGFDPDDESPMTILESIKKNHWITVKEGE